MKAETPKAENRNGAGRSSALPGGNGRVPDFGGGGRRSLNAPGPCPQCNEATVVPTAVTGEWECAGCGAGPLRAAVPVLSCPATDGATPRDSGDTAGTTPRAVRGTPCGTGFQPANDDESRIYRCHVCHSDRFALFVDGVRCRDCITRVPPEHSARVDVQSVPYQDDDGPIDCDANVMLQVKRDQALEAVQRLIDYVDEHRGELDFREIADAKTLVIEAIAAMGLSGARNTPLVAGRLYPDPLIPRSLDPSAPEAP